MTYSSTVSFLILVPSQSLHTVLSVAQHCPTLIKIAVGIAFVVGNTTSPHYCLCVGATLGGGIKLPLLLLFISVFNTVGQGAPALSSVHCWLAKRNWRCGEIDAGSTVLYFIT